LLSFIAFATLATPIKDPNALNIGRNVPPRFGVGSIRFFVAFFLVVFFFGFPMPMSLLAAQMTAAVAFSFRAESLVVMHFHAFSANTLSAA